jgi:hypothetical protein
MSQSPEEHHGNAANHPENAADYHRAALDRGHLLDAMQSEARLPHSKVPLDSRGGKPQSSKSTEMPS